MTFNALTVRVMIASPSDAVEARDAIERAIHSWNDAHSASRQVVLLPWRWETSAVPQMGDHPQAVINEQGLDGSDIVFGLFWGRVGSPTPEAVSGSVEEIEKGIAAGKRVHLYFSSAPLPSNVDIAQLEGLRAFRTQMEQRGLVGEFKNMDQLTAEVWKCIEADLPSISGTPLTEVVPSERVAFLVQPGSETEVTFSRGEPRSNKRHWVDITNRSNTTDAEQVEFELLGRVSMRLMTPNEPVTIHAGQRRRLAAAYFMGGNVDEPRLRIKWLENDAHRERDFDIGQG